MAFYFHRVTLMAPIRERAGRSADRRPHAGLRRRGIIRWRFPPPRAPSCVESPCGRCARLPGRSCCWGTCGCRPGGCQRPSVPVALATAFGDRAGHASSRGVAGGSLLIGALAIVASGAAILLFAAAPAGSARQIGNHRHRCRPGRFPVACLSRRQIDAARLRRSARRFALRFRYRRTSRLALFVVARHQPARCRGLQPSSLGSYGRAADHHSQFPSARVVAGLRASGARCRKCARGRSGGARQGRLLSHSGDRIRFRRQRTCACCCRSKTSSPTSRRRMTTSLPSRSSYGKTSALADRRFPQKRRARDDRSLARCRLP